jgi:hypothetical protein
MTTEERLAKNESTKKATNRFRWLWPSVHTLQGAHEATRVAFWFALVVVVVSAIFSILAQDIVSPLYNLLGAALFGAIAIGLYRHSRVAAVAALFLYVLEQVARMSEGAIPRYDYWWIMPLFLTLMFLGGVRGAFSYHRLKRAAAQEQANESKDTEKGGLMMTTEERLTALEQKLAATRRRFRWLLVGLALGLGALVLVWVAQGGGAAVNEVRARRLVLVDNEGRERAALEMIEDVPMLSLRNAAGNIRAALDVTPEGPTLSLCDAAGKFRAALSVDADGPMLSLADETATPRVVLGVDADGPGLCLTDEAGKKIWRAP